MNHQTCLIASLALAAAPALGARGEVHIVTSTPTLADIARQVGGGHVSVESVMKGPENFHNIIAKPSHMMRLRKADLFIHLGLDAEPWVPLIIRGSRQGHLYYGEPGNVDASRGIALKEVPARGELTRAEGDIHVFGNPHYHLDPLNGVIIARTIADALIAADSPHRDDYEKNFQDFAGRIDALTTRLTERMRAYQGTPIAVYHRSWPYFVDRFGLRQVAEVQPKPGIEPGPRHLSDCIETMERAGARVVITETFNNIRNAEYVAERVGGRAVVLAHEVGAVPEATSYEALVEYNVDALIEAFQAIGATAAPDGSTP